MSKGTALGVARDRFVESLSDKARALRGTLALVAASPRADRQRDELYRRFSTLHASAQAFRLTHLSDALQDHLSALEHAKRDGREVTADELDAMANLIAVLPTFGTRSESQVGPLPTGPDSKAPPPVEGRKRRNTGRGLPSLSSLVSEPEDPVSLLDADGVISVLVVDEAAVADLVKEALAPGRHEILHATSTEEAMRTARSRAPDVVAIARESATQDRYDLITRLRSDRLTSDVPIALLYSRGDALTEGTVRELGADAQVERSAARLRTRLLALGNVAHTPPSVARIGEATLKELASRLAEEVERGILDAAAGRERPWDLGDGSDLLAAAWTAVAEVRAKLEEKSDGRVRYRAASGPSFMQLESSPGTVVAPPAEPVDIDLQGVRVVVADDDPAIRWFFANLLQEAGAEVFEAADGDEALEMTRARRPDLLISDIVMPSLDGPAVCRALERDPIFSHLPVILLSWKEDFVERMKELHSAAVGYLRKEAEAAVVLTKVEEVLAPQRRLTASLSEGDSAGGRIEGLGAYRILQETMARMPDAQVTVRDNQNLYQAEIRGGQLIDVTRTAKDGGFRRGQPALRQMLGVAHGRYNVESVSEGKRARVSVRLGEGDAVTMAARRLRACILAFERERQHEIQTVLFDDDFLAPLLSQLSEPVAGALRRVRSGLPPRDAIAGGAAGTADALLNMARRGAVIEVRGSDGADLLSALEETHAEDADTAPEHDSALKPPLVETAATDNEVEEDAPNEDSSEDNSGTADEEARDEEDDRSEEVEADDEEEDADDEESDVEEDADDEESDVEEDADNEEGDVEDPDDDTEEAAPEQARAPKEEAPEAEEDASDDSSFSWKLGPTLVAVALCFFVGRMIWGAMHPGDTTPSPAEDPETSEAGSVPNSPAENVPEEPSEPPPENPPEETQGPAADPPESPANTQPSSPLAFGRLEPLPSDVSVEPGEGLLSVDGPSGIRLHASGAEDLNLGTPPVRRPLPAGEYELRMESDEGTRIRFVHIPEGRHRVITLP